MRRGLMAVGVAAALWGLVSAQGAFAATVDLTQKPAATADPHVIGVQIGGATIVIESLDGQVNFDPAGLQFVSLTSSVFAGGDILTNPTPSSVIWTATPTAGVTYTGGTPLVEITFLLKPGVSVPPTYTVALEKLAVNETEYVYLAADPAVSNLVPVQVEQQVPQVPLPAAAWLLLGALPLLRARRRG